MCVSELFLSLLETISHTLVSNDLELLPQDHTSRLDESRHTKPTWAHKQLGM
jgi:hypothetical protein